MRTGVQIAQVAMVSGERVREEGAVVRIAQVVTVSGEDAVVRIAQVAMVSEDAGVRIA